MDAFGSFIESFSSRNVKLLIYGILTTGLIIHHKPYSSEFMEPLNINNFENQTLRFIHASGHTLHLVLRTVDSADVDHLNVLPISSSISVHDMVSFCVNFPKT